MAKSPAPKDAWTRPLRALVNGSERAHPLDPPGATLSLDDAWSALRALMASMSSFQRDYDGDPIWVERCRRVEAELAEPSPPTSLDHGVEVAREHMVAIMDLVLRQPKERPYLHALAALRVRVGGPVFVADYLTRPTGAVLQSSAVRDGAGYTLTLTTMPEAGEALESSSAGASGDASPCVPSEAFLFAPIAELRAVRRHLFTAPEADFQRGAALVAERVHTFAKTRWDHAHNAVFAFGRDRQLAVPWVRAGLAVPIQVDYPFRTTNLEASFVSPEMLSCTDDGALAEAIVTRWLERDLNPASCGDHLADLVDAIGPRAIPALDKLATAKCDAQLRKRTAALRAIAASL